MQPVVFSVLNRPDDQVTSLVIIDPTGRKFDRDVIRDANGHLYVQYQPTLHDPTGWWVFELDPYNRKLRWEVNIQPPQKRYLYLLSDDPFQPEVDTLNPPYRLLLTGFQPDEDVRLIGYTFNMDWEAVGWQDLTVGADGSLEIRGDTAAINYVAYGAQTGEAHLFSKQMGAPMGDVFASIDLYCPGAPVTRLIGFSQARVTAEMLPGCAAPGYASSQLLSEPAGTQVQITIGPRCADGVFWFEIELPDGLGWIPETQDGVYVVEQENQVP